MCRPCSSMRSFTPRPLAPLPPRRQPYWYRVMLSYRCSQPGRLSSMAAVMPATPPPRTTTRGRFLRPGRSPNGGLPEHVPQVDVEVEVEPERHLGRARRGHAELALDGLPVELRDRDLVVAGQHAAGMEGPHRHVDEDERLVARG